MDYSIIINAVVLSTFLVALFEYFGKKRKDPEYVHPIDRLWRGGSLNVWILVVGAVAALVLLVRSLGNAPLDPKIFESYGDVEEVEIAFNWPQEHWIDSIQKQLDNPFCYGEVVNVRMSFASGTVIAPWVSGQHCSGDYHLMDVSVIMVLLNAERKVLIDDKIVALAELEDSLASKLRNDRSLSFNKLKLFSAQFDDEALEEDRAALFEGVMRGYEAYCEVLAHENFGVGLKELDPDTWRTLDQRFAFVVQAFLPPPPPPPPADYLVSELTLFVLQPDSADWAAHTARWGEEYMKTALERQQKFQARMMERAEEEGLDVIWEERKELAVLNEYTQEYVVLKKDLARWYEYYFCNGDSIFETNVFLEGTQYEQQAQESVFKPTVESENLELHLSDTAYLDLNGNSVDEMVFLDFGECTSLVIREEGAEDIRIGCGAEWGNEIPNDIGWVDEWSLEAPGLKWESFLDAEDMLDERQVSISFWGVYIGKQEASGGILCYIDGELVYLHQGC